MRIQGFSSYEEFKEFYAVAGFNTDIAEPHIKELYLEIIAMRDKLTIANIALSFYKDTPVFNREAKDALARMEAIDKITYQQKSRLH